MSAGGEFHVPVSVPVVCDNRLAAAMTSSHQIRWASYSSLCFRARCLCGWADEHNHVMESSAKGAYNAHIPAGANVPGTHPAHVHAFRDVDGILRVGCDADLCDKCRTASRPIAELAARLMQSQRLYRTVDAPVGLAIEHVGGVETVRDIASFRIVTSDGRTYTIAVAPD